MSLNSMLETSLEWKNSKADFVQPARNVHFDQGMHIVVPDTLFGAVAPMPLTEWALQQACEKLGPPPFSYIKQCPKRLAAVNLNHWRLALPRGRTWMVRSYAGDARAILSDRYLPIGVDRVLEWMVDLVGDNYKSIRPFMTPDSLHLKLMVKPPDADDRNFGYGVYIREGEVGNLTLGVAGFIQRTSCSNSIVFDDDTALRIVHLAGRYTIQEVRTLFKISLNVAISTAVERRDAIAKAEEEEVLDFASVVESLCKRNNFGEDLRDQILIGSEGNQTRMGLVNGVSFAAHSVIDQDEAVRMESLAGSILVSKDSLFGRVIRQNEEVEA